MTTTILARQFEHNNWANLELLRACATLTEAQLDEVNPAASDWSVRFALTHLVEAQRAYLSLLTLPPDARPSASLSFDELRGSMIESGNGLLALAGDETGTQFETLLRSTDGYSIEPWVVMAQAINHASDHRRQVRRNMRFLGVTPPDLDCWAFAEAVGAMTSESA